MATIERSVPEKVLDQKIQAANARRKAHEQRKATPDPWARFRASLSMARGSRTIGIG
jgi:hypothetical protein